MNERHPRVPFLFCGTRIHLLALEPALAEWIDLFWNAMEPSWSRNRREPNALASFPKRKTSGRQMDRNGRQIGWDEAEIDEYLFV